MITKQAAVKIERPEFISVSLAHGLKWKGGGDWIYEEKMDGIWSVCETEQYTLVGEQMADGLFFAFDCLIFHHTDISECALRVRLNCLDILRKHHPALLRPAHGNGAEFLEAVLARGGEGVVAKHLDAPFGDPWHKCKRVETLDLVVTEKNLTSIRLADNGQDRGWCKVGAIINQIHTGDIVEIAAYGLTAKGKLRESRFVRVRHDKKAAA